MHVESSTTLGRLRRLELSPARYLQLTLVSVGALWLIVLTGAAVRVTDSGLGCRHWPGCEAGRPLPAKDDHAVIEFGNRALGGVVILVVLLTAVAARFVPGLSRRGKRLALWVFAIDSLNGILHRCGEFAVGPTELLEEHVSKGRVGRAYFYRVHQFFNVVVHIVS